MRVFFVGHADYAASGHLFARALDTVPGVETRVLVEQPHGIDHPIRFHTSTDPDDYREGIEWAHVVHFIQGDWPACCGGEYPPAAWMKARAKLLLPVEESTARWIRRGPKRPRPMDWLRGKAVVLQVGNSFVRQIPEFYVDLWRGKADVTISHASDLMDVGLPNAVLMLPPIDDRWVHYQPRPDRDQLVIGHYPTNPRVKGSADILATLDAIHGIEVRRPDVRVGPHTVILRKWETQIARMAACDAYVDQIMPRLDGQRFGSWCSAATEAMGLGCITFANELRPEHFLRTYSVEPPMYHANTPEELGVAVEELVKMERREWVAVQRETAAVARKLFGLEATGKLLMERVYGDLAAFGGFAPRERTQLQEVSG